MERKKHSGTRPSPPKQSPDKVKNASEGLMGKFPAPATFSLKAFLRSFFACSGSGVECGDDPPIYQENIIKKPVISPTRPLDTKKQRRSKHSVPTTPQVQHESVIALSTSLNKLEANDNLKERPVVANDSPDSNKKNSDTPLPNISEPSTVLSESLRSSLCTYLPTLVQGRDWVLLYSTWKHGISLRTLYRRSAHLSGPCLLAIEDSKGAVFGGLLTAPLNPTAKPKFQGTHQSFVFTNVTTDLAVFRATGSNRYYFLCTKDMLVLGGGGTFALRLDGDLTYGSSGLSETFGNCCLSHMEEFSIRHVELWGFAHTSKYVPEQARYRSPRETPAIARI